MTGLPTGGTIFHHTILKTRFPRNEKERREVEEHGLLWHNPGDLNLLKQPLPTAVCRLRWQEEQALLAKEKKS